MNHFLHGVARSVVEAFELPEPVMEIGSYQVAGQESLINLRSLFRNKEYLGVDVRPGPGVDCVADVESLPQATGSVGSVVALSTFEHVPHFWRGFEEVHRVLRPDGVLFVSCPFYFHIHNHPSDYWRFTPEALRVLLCDYPQKIVGWHGPKNRPSSVWAIAFREECPAISLAQFTCYQSLMQRYAREPMKRSRKLRYRLASLLCGGGPFAPYLKQNTWNIEFKNDQNLLASPFVKTAAAPEVEQQTSLRKAA